MFHTPFHIFFLEYPVKRSFHWGAFVALILLFFFGNLAGIPLLRKTNIPVEPVWQWGVFTLFSALIIAFGLLLANRTRLGAPLLEGRLSKEDFPNWLRCGLALTVLMLVLGFPLSLIANLGANSLTYPFGWELFAASFKAGVVEEIFSRLFLVSLFVWLGMFFKSDAEGRPRRGVYWLAILIAGILFGWGHVEARLGNPEAIFGDYVLIMVLNSGLGIYFGWLFWSLGLEWAMFAHFAYDAFVSMIVIPVYLLKSPVAWLILITGLVFVLVISWRFLTQDRPVGVLRIQ